MQNSIADLEAFLTFADDAISKVNTLKGYANGASVSQTSKAPATWGERVIEIFKQAENKPIMQRQVVDMYGRTGWPMPADPGQLYRALSGAIAYLHKKKGVLIKTADGYQLKE